MTAMRGMDHDGLLSGLEQGALEPDYAYRARVRVPDFDDEKCPLCTKTIWPDDPTSMVQLSSDVGEQEVHRLCGLELRVARLEKKLSALAGRVSV